MEEEKKGFVVKDKRIFSEGGDVRAGEEPAAKEEAEKPDVGPDEPNEADRTEDDYLPEINFYNFIVSLSTTALYHFGDFSDPGADKVEKNLPAAKQLIDTITMIKNKTEGNLEGNERTLIDGVLFELRMRYLKETS